MKVNTVRTIAAAFLALNLMVGSVFAASVPSDVEALNATPGDGTVTLTWDAATGPAEITKYMVFQGTTSVTRDSGRYSKRYEVGNVTEYTVNELENGTTYYFSVIAFDENGEHSENYSNEASATPNGSTQATPEASPTAAANAISPKVSNALAANNEEVIITFSKDIVLPTQNPEKAFSIKENITDAKLEVLGAEAGLNAKSVIITTEKQTANAEYVLTVHTDIKDTDGNPIISGTSDTASFSGSATDKATATPESTPDSQGGVDTTAPSVKEVNTIENGVIEVVFTEDVVLNTEKPEDQFKITEKDSDLNEIAISKVSYKENEKNTVIIETDVQEANKEYVITMTEIKDAAGNTMSDLLNENKATYTAKEITLKDTVPPEDVTQFMAQLISDSVRLQWTASANTAKDLVDQILYQSTNDGEFTQIKNLGPAVTSYTIKNLTAGIKYTFKLTVKDAAGNESEGVITTITLPATGAGLGVSLLGTTFGMLAYHRKRRK